MSAHFLKVTGTEDKYVIIPMNVISVFFYYLFVTRGWLVARVWLVWDPTPKNDSAKASGEKNKYSVVILLI